MAESHTVKACCQWLDPKCPGYDGFEGYRWVHVDEGVDAAVYICQNCHAECKSDLRPNERVWENLPKSPYGGSTIDEIYDTSPFDNPRNPFIEKCHDVDQLLKDLKYSRKNAHCKKTGFACHQLITMPNDCEYFGDGLFKVLTVFDNEQPSTLWVSMKLQSKALKLHPNTNESHVTELKRIKSLKKHPKETQVIVFSCSKFNTGGSVDNINIKQAIIKNARNNKPTVTHSNVHHIKVRTKNGPKGTAWIPQESFVYEPKAAAATDADSNSAKTSATRMLTKYLNLKMPTRAVINQKMHDGDLNCNALTILIVKTYALMCLRESKILCFKEFIESL